MKSCKKIVRNRFFKRADPGGKKSKRAREVFDRAYVEIKEPIYQQINIQVMDAIWDQISREMREMGEQEILTSVPVWLREKGANRW